jgi:hypothetical protein
MKATFQLPACEMRGKLIEFERFDVRERLRIHEAGNRFECGVSARIDDHIRSSELTRGPVGKRGLERFRPSEATGVEDQFRACLLAVIQVSATR